MLVIPSSVPYDIGLCIRRVMHNESTPSDWKKLDRFGREDILTAVRTMLVANGQGDMISRELVWWKDMLFVPGN